MSADDSILGPLKDKIKEVSEMKFFETPKTAERKEEVWCPRCADDVLVPKNWANVECPICKLPGHWDTDYDPQTGDEWHGVEWSSYE